MREAGSTRSRWLLTAAAAMALCLVVFFGRGAASVGAGPAPVTLRAAFDSFPDYLDPQLSYTNEGWTAMYETYIPLLTFRRASGRAGADVIPGLAERLPEVTNGGRTYTLFLRQGLRYSDGTLVKASHFEYAIKRLLKLHSGGSPFYTAIVGARRFQRTRRGGISGIVSDNGTGRIVIHLRRLNSTFTNLLALPFAAPVPPDTPMRDLSFNPPPATGPYAITEANPEDGWSYVRNPAWEAGNGRLLPQLPDGYVDRIEARIVRNADAQVRGVVAGRLDWMQSLPPADRFRELRRRYGGTQFRAEPTLSTYYFWMNTSKPPFNDVRVRRAANHAVDRRVLQRLHGGMLTPSQQILPPGLPGYRRFALYPHDMAKARRLVAAADPPDRQVTVWTDTGSTAESAASYYRGQLEKIGLRARLKVVDSFSYFWVTGKRSAPNLDTGWSNWFADYPHPDDFFRPLLLGSSILPVSNGNYAQLSVPALDAKVEKLSERPLTPRRERGYAALDRGYMKLAPWVPFGNLTLSTFVAEKVDLESVVWNPLFGADLASFRFED